MNRSLLSVIALLAAVVAAVLLFAACNTAPDDKDAAGAAEPTQADAETATEAPVQTDEPEATEEPLPTEEPEPTEEPIELPYNEVVPFDEELSIDLDGDGKDERVFIETVPSTEYEYDFFYNIRIYEEGEEEPAFVHEIEYASYEAYALAVDNGTEDGKKALLFCRWFDSDDYETCVIRPLDEGGFDAIDADGYFPDPENIRDCFADGYLAIYYRTEILGTGSVYTRSRLCGEGFESVDGLYYYPGSEAEGSDLRFISVIAPLPVTVNDEGTGESYGMTATPGSYVAPLYTDMATFVCVKLSSGETALIFFSDYDSFIPYIDGQPQHYYLDVLYAD